MRADLKELSNNTQNEHPMQYKDLETFLKDGVAALTKGPVATIFVEDDVVIATRLRHHQHAGFARFIAFMPDAFEMPRDLQDGAH
jgi:hypothetical protein